MPVSRLDTERARKALQEFRFSDLFVEELGWNNPTTRKPVQLKDGDGRIWIATEVSQLSGFRVFEVTSADSDTALPDARNQQTLWKALTAQAVENVAIFLDRDRSQSLWFWMKREEKRFLPRRHHYLKGQPGDLFLSKLAAMVVDISELDEEGNIPITEVADRLKAALDVEVVTKRFYKEFQQQHLEFLAEIDGIPDERQRRWYASVLLNRLMFIYFLQRKFFLDGGNIRYLQDKLDQSKKLGRDQYYSGFLKTLFFEGFAKPEKERSSAAKKLLGQIRYLNGGLFLPHKVEMQHGKNIRVSDKAFHNLFALFERYSWNLDDTPGGAADEINPDVLGYIFEKYINQKEFGAYYTRPEITGYLCEQTIYKLVLDKINAASTRQFASMPELLLNLDANLCHRLLEEVLPSLSLLDPACGSGAFLVAAMKTLINLYSAIVGKIDFLHDRALTDWLAVTRAAHPSLHYFIKKRIITENLFGVDIMEEGAEIARLRLFLALVASAHTVEQLEPLPNIDFNILAGNSLIGLLKVDPQRFDAVGEKKSGGRQGLIKLSSQGSAAELPAFAVETTVAPSQREKVAAFVAVRNAGKFAAILADKNKSIELYRKHAFQPEEIDVLDQDTTLVQLRSHIDNVRAESYAKLNQLLLDEFNALGIQFEEATWDDAKNKQGKAIKRPLILADIEALNPFHWGYEFDQIINERGGFDAIITNSPWEIFKPNSKEFFEEYSDLVSKKNMSIHDFEEARAKLLKDAEVRAAWLRYLSEFPHVSAYFRAASDYRNQISVVNGRKAGSDVNLYKLFVERCFNLARNGGRSGVITPAGLYTDLGTKQLREMLFYQADLNTVFGFSNEKFLFENVHHAQKFCLAVFQKGRRTEAVEIAFRINPREAVDAAHLDEFLNSSAEHLRVSVELIRRLSPDSLSMMEFKTPADIEISKRMLEFPLLGEKLADPWNFALTAEFHMTSDSKLFRKTEGKHRFCLFEGKMTWQFSHTYSPPRFWVEEREGRKALLGKERDTGQKLDYQSYRCGIRAVASNTNERSLIASVLPSKVFCGNSVLVSAGSTLDGSTLLFLTAVLNSFVLDAVLRMKVSQNINMFYIYQLPVPRLTEKDAAFAPIVSRSAKLICTTPEFDDLALEVGLGSHANGVTDPAGRATLRAELDALVAHLYGLTEEEFAYILTTFPLVSQEVKALTLNTFIAMSASPDDNAVHKLINGLETDRVEFKEAAAFSSQRNEKSPNAIHKVIREVAAFLNSGGGNVIIGVTDAGKVVGIASDILHADPKKDNHDGYELFLRNSISGKLGAPQSSACKITFHKIENHEVCRILVPASSTPVYLDGNLIIRDGTSSRQLSAQQATEYIARHWLTP